MLKPDWLRVKAPQRERIGDVADLLQDLKLTTVCVVEENRKRCLPAISAEQLVDLRVLTQPAWSLSLHKSKWFSGGWRTYCQTTLGAPRQKRTALFKAVQAASSGVDMSRAISFAT